MARVLIIGGGFAGLSSAARLARCGLELTLLDRKETTDFLPMLPDCIGRGVNPEFLSHRIEKIAAGGGIKFICAQVASIDLEKRQVLTQGRALSYDYLLIASGSETNFYANENIKQSALALDSAADAGRLIGALRQNESADFIIAGGGYTGIEIAGNLRLYLDKRQRNGRIIIVERAPAILGPLPEWMKNYVLANLKKLKVEVCLNTTIEKINARNVSFSGGRAFDNALVIWAAGVKTAGFIQELKLEKNPQGRIKVDEYLRVNATCFAAGDAAFFTYQQGPLRMAVQFAIAQGECAALNIINSIKGRPLKKFIPRDLGYIIPMANNRSCGAVLGMDLKGWPPTALHFIMCIYRAYGIKNKLGIIRGLIKWSRTKNA